MKEINVKDMNKDQWYKKVDVLKSASSRSTIEQMAYMSFINTALYEDKCVYYYYKQGNTINEPIKLVDEISNLGGKAITITLSEKQSIDKRLSDDAKYLFSWDNAVLSLSFEHGWSHLECNSLEEGLALKLKEIADKYIIEKTQNKIYVFANGMEGPELKQVNSDAGVPLERENYAPNVIEDFDYINQELCSSDPSGRLIIISGSPGTGKTYYIRGLTNAVDNAMFVLVQASVVADLMSPQVIPVLMDYHKKHNQPIIFVIEDADSILIQREGDNMNAIASLLNMGDGLFGTLFNLKVVATTNARSIDIDKALLRSGRCSRYIEINNISNEQANNIYKRLTANATKILPEKKGGYILADVYKLAREDSQEAKITQPHKEGAGFIKYKQL